MAILYLQGSAFSCSLGMWVRQTVNKPPFPYHRAGQIFPGVAVSGQAATGDQVQRVVFPAPLATDHANVSLWSTGQKSPGSFGLDHTMGMYTPGLYCSRCRKQSLSPPDHKVPPRDMTA